MRLKTRSSRNGAQYRRARYPPLPSPGPRVTLPPPPPQVDSVYLYILLYTIMYHGYTPINHFTHTRATLAECYFFASRYIYLFYFISRRRRRRRSPHTSRNPVVYDRPKKYTPPSAVSAWSKKTKKKKTPTMPRGYCDYRRRSMRLQAFRRFSHSRTPIFFREKPDAADGYYFYSVWVHNYY